MERVGVCITAPERVISITTDNYIVTFAAPEPVISIIAPHKIPIVTAVKSVIPFRTKSTI
jgi:hypothetical protein